MSDNPFLKRISSRAIMAHGKESEKRLAKKIGAKLHPSSGALKSAKSDFSKESRGMKFRMEAKSTVHDTLPIDLGWLTKISHEASADGSVPAITLSFVLADGKPRGDRNPEWVMMPIWALQELLDRVE